jgi:hypothetical protein
VGKALADGFLFPLPLALPFIELAFAVIRGTGGLPRVAPLAALPRGSHAAHTAAVAALKGILHSPLAASILAAYYPSMRSLLDVARTRLAQRMDPAAGGELTLRGGVSVEDLTLSWVHPGSDFPLIFGAVQAAAGWGTAGEEERAWAGLLAGEWRGADALAAAMLPAEEYASLVIDPTGGDVTTGGVDLFLGLFLLYTARLGIGHALAPFVAGLSATATPLSALTTLTPAELRDAYCGSPTVEWSMETLAKHVGTGGGYDASSRPVVYFFQTLVGMSQTERADFLRFATGCPALPPGGLAALLPPLKLMQKLDVPPLPLASRPGGVGGAARGGVVDVDVEEITDSPARPMGTAAAGHDRALPSASTCFHHVRLPPYSSAAVTRAQLLEAIGASAGLLDLS